MTDALSQAEAAVRAGQPAAALEQLSAAVRARPADARLRVFLAQLLCVLGQWQRAHAQLNVAAELDATSGPMREMVGHALRCELLRAEVFAGKRPPLVFGHPPAWLAQLVESLLQAARDQQGLSQSLAAAAFDAAPAVAGRLDGQPFSWIADADSRLGPVLEAMVLGRYYWIPFQNLASVQMDAPVDLRDGVWMPATLEFANGGNAIAMIPVRYPGTERSTDSALLMARRTDWRDIGPDRFAGLGQRVLVTDLGEHDLMGIRRIELDALPAGDGQGADEDVDG